MMAGILLVAGGAFFIYFQLIVNDPAYKMADGGTPTGTLYRDAYFWRGILVVMAIPLILHLSAQGIAGLLLCKKLRENEAIWRNARRAGFGIAGALFGILILVMGAEWFIGGSLIWEVLIVFGPFFLIGAICWLIWAAEVPYKKSDEPALEAREEL